MWEDIAPGAPLSSQLSSTRPLTFLPSHIPRGVNESPQKQGYSTHSLRLTSTPRPVLFLMSMYTDAHISQKGSSDLSELELQVFGGLPLW